MSDEDDKVVNLGERRDQEISRRGEEAYLRGEAFQLMVLDGYALSTIGVSSEGEVVMMHDPEDPLLGLAMEPELAKEIGLALIGAAEHARIAFSEEAYELRQWIADRVEDD